MEFEFKDNNLLDLYTKGKSRKYRFEKNVIRNFVKRVVSIENSNTIFDLRKPPSMRFEKLEGYQNSFSIRINGQFRLEFDINFEDENKTKGKVEILTISKHYK